MSHRTTPARLRLRSLSNLAFTLVLASAVPVSAQAVTISFIPVSDASGQDTEPNQMNSSPIVFDDVYTFLHGDTSSIGFAHTLIQPQNTNSPHQRWRFPMEFDISAIPGGSIVNSATLTVTPASIFLFEGSPFHLDLYSYTADGTVTLSDMTGGSALSSVGITTTALSTISFDVTSLLSTLVSGSIDDVGLRLQQSEVPSSLPAFAANVTGIELFTSNDSTPSRRPTLTVDYVPEPTTGLLLAAGLIGLAVSGRNER